MSEKESEDHTIYYSILEGSDADTAPLSPAPPPNLPTKTSETKHQTSTEHNQHITTLARRGCAKATECYRWYDGWRTIMFDLLTTTSNTESNSPEHQVRLLALRSLVRDFEQQAEKYGKIIIEERDVEFEFKTLKPCQMGGWAGGLKYLFAGILFKFADSVPLPTELANKISAIEFNSAQSIHASIDRARSSKEQLTVPLTSVIDYLGYRLEAVAFSPINNCTLVYGSCDAGKTVKNSDPMTDSLMKRYGEKLNVCSHWVRQRSNGKDVAIIGAADVEVHLVQDGDSELRIVVDSSRLFPPLPPAFGAHKLLHLARRFRPELVQMYGRPLNGDVYTIFQSTADPQLDNHYTNILDCRNFLSNQVKKAAQQLVQNFREGRHVTALPLFVRAFGINMSLLGELRHRLSDIKINDRFDLLAVQSAKAVVLVEILARTLKQLIRAKFRRLLCPNTNAKANKTTLDTKEWCHTTALGSDFNDAVLSFLNTAFSFNGTFRRAFKEPPLGHMDEWNQCATTGSSLKNAVHLRFKHGLQRFELSETFDIIRDGLASVYGDGNRTMLCHKKLVRKVLVRLERGLGLTLSEEARQSCIRLDPQLNWPFDSRHVEALIPVSKSMGGFFFLEGVRLLKLAKKELQQNQAQWHPANVRYFGPAPFLTRSKRSRSPTPGSHRVSMYRHFGFAVGETPTNAGLHLSKAIAVLTKAVAIQATDASRRLALGEALFLRGRSWCDLEDLKLAAEHIDVIFILQGSQSSHQYYKTCTLLTDLLFCLDKLSFRLIRKLTSISSQQTMGRHPQELFAIAEYVQTLRAVSLTASRCHDKNLRRISILVNHSIHGFHQRVKCANLICCCKRGEGCFGKRGFAHPIDLFSLFGLFCCSLWIIGSFLSQADGFAGFTEDNTKTFVLTTQMGGASVGIMYVSLLLRKSTKRWSQQKRMFILLFIFVFAVLFVAHLCIAIIYDQDSEKRLKLAPVSTLALFFTNIIPCFLMLAMWSARLYFNIKTSKNKSLSITSYNPFDFLDRSLLVSYSDRDLDQTSQNDGPRKEEAGEAKEEENVGSVNILRQSSRFGAMSRFGSLEEDDDDDRRLLLRGSSLREPSLTVPELDASVRLDLPLLP